MQVPVSDSKEGLARLGSLCTRLYKDNTQAEEFRSNA